MAEAFARMAWAVEKPLAFAATIVALVVAFRFLPLRVNRMFGERAAGVGLVRLAVLAGIAWIVVVLNTVADADIDGFYNWLFGALAIACLLVAAFARPILGITHRGDIVERGNRGAALVLAGFVLGTAFAFAGALTGDDLTIVRDATGSIVSWEGGWHVVFVFFLLAYFELRTNVKLVDRMGDLDDAARDDRDTSAGVLLAGVAIASGLVAGRAAAGDFLGWREGLTDYVKRLWPMVAIPVVASLAGRLSAMADSRMAVRATTAGLLVAGAAAYYAFT